MIHEAAARGFAQAAGAYERGRPGYPPAAVERLCDVLGVAPGRAVLDLAAGTGKLTRLLVATGAELVAVEPVEQMRAALSRALPEVTALAGTAEDIPLPDDSADAVVAGSAFHWFRGDEALAEIHRVLRPAGRLALLWNVRDESVRWVAELTAIMEPHRGAAPRYRSGAWRDAFARTALFSPLRHEEFRHVHRLEPEAVVARVASVSFVAALTESDRAAVLARVRALLARDPATRGREVVELRYRTDVWWCGAVRPRAGGRR
ncbi:MAG: class I SAM-dependent methyltransferase [Gaiellaceae bacterium]